MLFYLKLNQNLVTDFLAVPDDQCFRPYFRRKSYPILSQVDQNVCFYPKV